MTQRQYTRGFTLIELMVAIAVLAIAISTAVPAFTQTIRSTRMQASSDELFAFLLQARARAINERRTYQVRWQESAGLLDSALELAAAATPNTLEGRLGLADEDIDVRLFDAQGRSLPKLSGSHAQYHALQYRANGSVGSTVLLTLCRDDDPASGRLIRIQPSGSPTLYPPGKKGHGNDEDLTSCSEP